MLRRPSPSSHGPMGRCRYRGLHHSLQRRREVFDECFAGSGSFLRGSVSPADCFFGFGGTKLVRSIASVVLGFDGVAPNLLDPLIAAGALPNLRGVIERGVYGRLRTLRPVEEQHPLDDTRHGQGDGQARHCWLDIERRERGREADRGYGAARPYLLGNFWTSGDWRQRPSTGGCLTRRPHLLSRQAALARRASAPGRVMGA